MVLLPLRTSPRLLSEIQALIQSAQDTWGKRSPEHKQASQTISRPRQRLCDIESVFAVFVCLYKMVPRWSGTTQALHSWLGASGTEVTEWGYIHSGILPHGLLNLLIMPHGLSNTN